ncbi:MAG: DUF6514 family protein [Defluviitaleaceae bacterium]|nr:DUF6514 family protein [Defluviitaleaceae bacterium]
MRTIETKNIITEAGKPMQVSYTLIKNENFYGIEIKQTIENNIEKKIEFFAELEAEAEKIIILLAKHDVLISNMSPILDEVVFKNAQV